MTREAREACTVALKSCPATTIKHQNIVSGDSLVTIYGNADVLGPGMG